MPETLVTPRMSLRPLRVSDAGLMTMYSSDERVARMTSSIPHPYPPGAAETFIESIESGRVDQEPWAMDATRSGGQELIGVISLKADCGELGYWVGPPFWNTGYASEAVIEVVRHLFEDREMPELRARVFTDNPASRHVLEKTGFVVTGEGEGFSVSRAAAVPEWLLVLDRASWQKTTRQSALG